MKKNRLTRVRHCIFIQSTFNGAITELGSGVIMWRCAVSCQRVKAQVNGSHSKSETLALGCTPRSATHHQVKGKCISGQSALGWRDAIGVAVRGARPATTRNADKAWDSRNDSVLPARAQGGQPSPAPWRQPRRLAGRVSFPGGASLPATPPRAPGAARSACGRWPPGSAGGTSWPPPASHTPPAGGKSRGRRRDGKAPSGLPECSPAFPHSEQRWLFRAIGGFFPQSPQCIHVTHFIWKKALSGIRTLAGGRDHREQAVKWKNFLDWYRMICIRDVRVRLAGTITGRMTAIQSGGHYTGSFRMDA